MRWKQYHFTFVLPMSFIWGHTFSTLNFLFLNLIWTLVELMTKSTYLYIFFYLNSQYIIFFFLKSYMFNLFFSWISFILPLWADDNTASFLHYFLLEAPPCYLFFLPEVSHSEPSLFLEPHFNTLSELVTIPLHFNSLFFPLQPLILSQHRGFSQHIPNL